MIQQFLAADLIDDLTISVVPIALGAGIRLFAEAGIEHNFTLQESRGFPVSTTWSPANWVGAFAQGKDYAQKVGSTGLHVRRVQRALNAADPSLLRTVTGIFTRRTAKDVRAYQHRVGLPGTGIVNERTWARLRAGRG